MLLAHPAVVRWWVVVLLILVGASLCERTAAAAASARLFYGIGSGVEGCPDEAGLRRAIADRVGYDPVFPIASNDVEVTIAREGDRLVGDVKYVDRRHALVGGRTLQGRVGRCDDLVATIALTVAIALDKFEKTSALLPATADRPARDGDPTPPPDVDAGPETTTRPSNPAPPSGALLAPNVVSGGAPEARERASSHLAPSRLPLVPEVAVGVSGWIGTAPSFALGPTASVALRWRRVALGVEGQLQLPASAAVTGLPVGEVRTSLAEAGPVVCLALDPYFVCGLAFVGALHADAPGVPGSQAQTGVDVLAGPRAGTAVALGGGLSLRVSLDLLAEAYGPTVQAAGARWRPSPVAGGAQIALAWRIP